MTIYGATSPDSPRFQDEARDYDAVLVMSFGGPEGMDDVMPFLENVTRGRNVPRERLLEVAHHYELFGGVSPINEQNRALIRALEAELDRHGPRLPIYFGNRNWHPLIADTLRRMREDGVRRAITFVTSAFSCYSGCRQYREDLIRAREEVGEGAPELDKLRVFYNHPGFIHPQARRLRIALEGIARERHPTTRIVFTAHSIPLAQARHSRYEEQLREASRLVADRAGWPNHDLVYQSRSGPPHVPWLEPDILTHVEGLAGQGVTDLVVVPIGFISDHMEVLFDLDIEARELAEKHGMALTRVPTVGEDPEFVGMIRELVVERMARDPERRALGDLGPHHDVCPVDCCLPGDPGGRHGGAR